jgi:hypothetical protein
MKASKKTAVKASRKPARKPAKARPRPRPLAAAKPQRRPKAPRAAAARPATAAAGATPERLAQLVEQRLKQRAGEFGRVKTRFERVARALQALVVSAPDRAPKGGPRRFRPAPAQARDYQQQMAELGTELRLLTARRAELAWVQQQLTGSTPVLSASLKALLEERAKASSES